MRDFTLGRPALVCRWRLANRALPLENRHLRALSRRMVNGSVVSTQLVAWAKQHIEWTLADGAARYPDGVLMIIVDEEGRAAMTVGPYEPLSVQTTSALAERALRSAREADETGVAPETLWAFDGGRLLCGGDSPAAASGAASLVGDLARTIGIPVTYDAALAERAMAGERAYDEVFLTSDEHGVAVSSTAPGPRSRRFVEGYGKLFDASGRR
ncbi:hypothetical protein H9X80_02405 [Olsenella profusa]|uniref:Uncharacterized protein n=2 Tax=Olsenella profusa TaxID=138595 RepID=A0ABS2F098_9ACTN|nr:hypothetical protein [Olsenella profusa]